MFDVVFHGPHQQLVESIVNVEIVFAGSKIYFSRNSSTASMADDTSSSPIPFHGDVTFAKVCSLLILPVCSIVAGILPIRLGEILYKSGSKKKLIAFEKYMAFLLYFSGGVLLCTVFLHLLPELESDSKKIYERRILPKIPLSYSNLFVCVGFFFIYTVEQVLHAYIDRRTRQRSAAASANVDGQLELNDDADVKHDKVNGDNGYAPCEHERIHDRQCPNRNYHSCQKCHGFYAQPTTGHQHEESPHHAVSVCEFTDNQQLIRSGTASGLLTVLALSTHEIFEGMTVGLQKTVEMVWYLLAGISFHKTVLAAFVGLQLFSMKTSQMTSYVFVTVYALTSSLGILAGLIVSDSSTTADSNIKLLMTVFLQAIATGTLLYVIFFEIYTNHLSSYKLNGISKSVASICGFVFSALLQVLLSEPHQ